MMLNEPHGHHDKSKGIHFQPPRYIWQCRTGAVDKLHNNKNTIRIKLLVYNFQEVLFCMISRKTALYTNRA